MHLVMTLTCVIVILIGVVSTVQTTKVSVTVYVHPAMGLLNSNAIIVLEMHSKMENSVLVRMTSSVMTANNG